MVAVPLPKLRAAEKVIQRTYYVPGRSTVGVGSKERVSELLARQVEALTLVVLENHNIRYNQPTHEAVDRVLKRPHGEW